MFVLCFIKYFEQMYSGDGLRSDPSRVKEVVKSPRSANQKQLESFLGLVQYYGRLILKFSALAGFLNELPKKTVKIKRISKCQSTYDEIKKELSSHRVSSIGMGGSGPK